MLVKINDDVTKKENKTMGMFTLRQTIAIGSGIFAFGSMAANMFLFKLPDIVVDPVAFIIMLTGMTYGFVKLDGLTGDRFVILFVKFIFGNRRVYYKTFNSQILTKERIKKTKIKKGSEYFKIKYIKDENTVPVDEVNTKAKKKKVRKGSHAE